MLLRLFNLHISQPTQSDLFQLWTHDKQCSQAERELTLPLLNLVAKEQQMELDAGHCAA
jgi:hypothetical protein